MKIRLYYKRIGDLKFISHLNTIDLLQRAVLNSSAEVEFSEGFNPHPKMSFSNPLPLGVSSELEVFDVSVRDDINLEKFVSEINSFLPEEIQVIKAFDAENLPNISKIFDYSVYEFNIYSEKPLNIIEVDLGEELIVKRKKKARKNTKSEIIEENIVNNIKEVSQFSKIDENTYQIVATIENSFEKIINPLRFIEALLKKYDLDISIYDISIHKREMI